MPNMKAFLCLICYLLATIALSPFPATTAREFAKRDPIGGTNNPWKPVLPCGRGKRYCIPSAPKSSKPCPPYKRNCGPP